MKNKLIVLFVIAGFACFAQAPGYMGRKFVIGYSTYFFPAGIGPTANTQEEGQAFSGVNITHCLNLEYTIKNRTNFCVSIQTLKTGIAPGVLYSSRVYDSGGWNSYYYSYEYNPKPFVPMQLRTFNVGLGFKFFQRGSLSPIGKYKKLELLLLFSKLTYDKNSFLQQSDATGFSGPKALGTGENNYQTFAITFTAGRSRVLFNRLVIDFGLRLGFLPAGIISAYNQNKEKNASSYTTSTSTSFDFDKVMRQETNQRLFRQQLINFHIGLGFLAF